MDKAADTWIVDHRSRLPHAGVVGQEDALEAQRAILQLLLGAEEAVDGSSIVG